MSRTSVIVDKPYEKTLKFKNERWKKGAAAPDQLAGFYYYIKPENEGEDGTNVLLPHPFKMIWIEDAQSVSGFNKEKNTGVYSNEILTNPSNKLVKEYGKKDLKVKCGKEIIATGQWKDIKGVVTAYGGKYCAPVYALVEIDGEWELVRFLISGGATKHWFNLTKNSTKMKSNFIVMEGYEEEEMATGQTFQRPILKFGEKIDKSLDAIINEATDKVDSYFEFLMDDSIEKDEEGYQPIDEDQSDEKSSAY